MLHQSVFLAAALPVLSHATLLRGVDVSHYQGIVDWAKVASVPGMTFACVKATEGTSYVDAQFGANWKGMHSTGLVRCAYHFARPGSNATAQAIFFVKTVNAAGGFASGTKTLQLMLDLEQTDGQSSAIVWAWTQEFVAALKRLTGRPAIMYTGHYFWTGSVGDPSDNLDCPLWIASYNGAALPTIPRAWSGYTFWQYGTNGAAAPGGKAAAIPGISGSSVDVDVFKYSADTLMKFCF